MSCLAPELQTVPDVGEDFPLPDKMLSEGRHLHVQMSPLGRYEPEMVLAALGTLAIRQQRWSAVSLTEFIEELAVHPWMRGHVTNVIDAVRTMAEQELLQLATVDKEVYIIPTQAFAQTLLHSTLGQV